MNSELRIDGGLNGMWTKFTKGQMLFGDFEVLYEFSKGKEVIVELGTSKGFGAMVLSMHGGLVYTVDNYLHRMADDEEVIVEENSQEVFESVKGYFKSKYKTITPLKGDTSEVAHQFPSESIDLLYIDGGHKYSEVKLDYDSWVFKVKSGGFILFHDYSVAHCEVKEFIDKEVMKDFKVKEIGMETLCKTVIKVFQKK